MKVLLISLLLILTATISHAERLCDPAKSKPCGKGCIEKDYTCHKKVTTAKIGIKTKE